MQISVILSPSEQTLFQSKAAKQADGSTVQSLILDRLQEAGDNYVSALQAESDAVLDEEWRALTSVEKAAKLGK